MENKLRFVLAGFALLPASRFILILTAITLTGCQSPPTPVLTETDGSYVRIPDSSTKVIVWGQDPEAIKSLKSWLLKRRITVIDEARIHQIGTEMNLPSPLSDANVLKAAKKAGVNQVIFVDANISRYDNVLAKRSHYAFIYIRALDVDSGEIDWNGKARSPQPFTDLTEGIDQLTCHALATAWGLRQPGLATAPSICLPGENAMVAAQPPTARYILATAKAFRTVYAKQIVAQAARSNVKADENWTMNDHGIMLPAQFLKAAGRELDDFELGLIGLTPIYKENLPKTKAEEEALQKLIANPSIGILTFEDGNHFKGLAADLAIADSCVACHNSHPTSAKKDFKKGDVMGAIVVRFNK